MELQHSRNHNLTTYCSETVSYYYGKPCIIINLQNLTNDILEHIEPHNFADIENNIVILEKKPTPELDIDKLLSKIYNIRKLHISLDCGRIKINKIPDTLKEYTESNENDIASFPNTLEKYNLINYRNDDPIIIPQLPDKDINITIFQGKCLNDTFYRLPSLITNISIDISTLGMDIDMWPINLKHLSIIIRKKDTSSIGILPDGLITLKLNAIEYCHAIDLPPTVEKFSFATNHKYNYSDCFNSLPDSIQKIKISYYNWSNIEKLPKKCKTLNYMNCPHDVYNKMTKDKQYKGVNIFKKNRIL
jgi:hypothetical protein